MELLKIGTKLDSFYGNGSYIGEKEIARITKHSIFFTDGQRESINTVNKNIINGIYKRQNK